MSGYRCVNFTDLCRLCSSASCNNIQIFGDDNLQKKISECLPITLNEKDKLPKVICSQCRDYVQVFSDFRESCSKAQKMLESCLNTSKLRNGGQVYIKDEVPTKKVLKPIQNPSPTKIIPITTTPTKQIKQIKNIITPPHQPDFLSSIMQAVGIQTNDEGTDNNISFSQNIQPQQATMQPQYTLTLDGGTLKSGQIQYKIENTGSMNIPQTQIIAKNVQDGQNQQPGSMTVDEFLKLNKKPIVLKKNPVAVAQAEEPKNKKPKFNLILQASPQKQKIVSPAPKTFGQQSTLVTPTKPQIQIHNVEKILPATNQVSPTKQLVLPIMMRHDGTARNADTAQLLSQLLSMNNNQTTMDNKGQSTQPFAYVQMKVDHNADGQMTLTPASSVQVPQHLQLSLSPQQLQQLSFQAPTQQPPALAMQPQITVTQVATQDQTDSQTQTVQPAMKSEAQEDEDNFDNYDDDYFIDNENDDDDTANESQEKIAVSTKPYIIKKAPKSIKPKKSKGENLTDLQAMQQGHSDIAKKQLHQLTSFNTKRAESENAEKPSDLNLTVCDVCKKVFKRKEFLMQHLKSHIGLRPFKCDEPTCNKSFSRKEHLLRHVVSHTGKKMFNCDVCNKLFSRKDNLNKHRRIHPDTGQQNNHHHCSKCSKRFSHRGQLAKHQLICDGKSDGSVEKDDEVVVKTEKSKSPEVVKKAKPKHERKPQETVKQPVASQSQTPAPITQQQQPQILTILQHPQQQQVKLKNEPQTQQIVISMSQAQAMLQAQPKGGHYTFPNLILNTNSAFMTNAGEVVGNFKFENQ